MCDVVSANRNVDIRCPTSDSGCDDLDARPSVRACWTPDRPMGRRRRETCEIATAGSSGESSELDTDSDRPSRGSSANNRERARMRVLSAAFGRLKNTLPWVPQDTKLSKLDTLRMASCYIANLAELLEHDPGDPRADAAAVTDRPPARLKLRTGFHRSVSLVRTSSNLCNCCDVHV